MSDYIDSKEVAKVAEDIALIYGIDKWRFLWPNGGPLDAVKKSDYYGGIWAFYEYIDDKIYIKVRVNRDPDFICDTEVCVFKKKKGLFFSSEEKKMVLDVHYAYDEVDDYGTRIKRTPEEIRSRERWGLGSFHPGLWIDYITTLPTTLPQQIQNRREWLKKLADKLKKRGEGSAKQREEEMHTPIDDSDIFK